MPRAVFATAVSAAAILMLLTGCGRVHAVGSNRTLELAVTEYRINPQAVTARPGQLTIVVHNYGRLSHNLAVLNGSVEMGATPRSRPARAQRSPSS